MRSSEEVTTRASAGPTQQGERDLIPVIRYSHFRVLYSGFGISGELGRRPSEQQFPLRKEDFSNPSTCFYSRLWLGSPFRLASRPAETQRHAWLRPPSASHSSFILCAPHLKLLVSCFRSTLHERELGPVEPIPMTEASLSWSNERYLSVIATRRRAIVHDSYFIRHTIFAKRHAPLI